MSEQISKREAHRFSFLELFKDENPVGPQFSHVEIPLIQRDYAQGRESAKAVRDRFLDSLLTSLKSDRWLSLDFVYGEVVKTGNNPSYFQPIDGQQRLTTLFLLHWYLACVAGCREDFAKRMQDVEKEPRFQYSVRKSSQQFFTWLLDFTPDASRCLAKQISDQAWSFGAWQHDSTIQGAIVMLEAIRLKFAGEDAKDFYNKLQQPNCPITLDVLKLGDLHLSDEIYIKMNARGKELTGFEKFKAWLIGNCWEERKVLWPDDGDEAKQWPILMDGGWLDLFWSFRDRQKPAESVSKAYFRTFLALAVNFHSLRGRFEMEWMTADCDDMESRWHKIFTEEALRSVFQNLRNFSIQVDTIASLRKALKSKKIPFADEPLCETFFEGGSKPAPPGLKERLWLHAICVFLEYLHECDRDDWFRVIRNLIENSDIEQKTFVNAVQSIQTLAQKCRSHSDSGKKRLVLSALEDISCIKELKGLDGRQKEEESLKASRMLRPEDGSQWEETMVEAEKHPVFCGQIGLLLDEDTALNLFLQRVAVFNNLLDDSGSKISKHGYLLTRAALSQCKSISLRWQQYIEFKDTPGQWRNLLGSRALGDGCEVTPKGEFRNGMQKLVNLLIGSVDYENDMSKLVCEPSVDRDWMDDVISYGHVFLQNVMSREQKVQNYYNNGTFIYLQTNSSERDIMLGRQAHWRNAIIKALLAANIGFDIDVGRKVIEIDADPPFYRGHQFLLTDVKDKRLPWQVSIRYRCVLLEKRNTDASQSSREEGRLDRVEFEYPRTTPEQIVECIKETIKS